MNLKRWFILILISTHAAEANPCLNFIEKLLPHDTQHLLDAGFSSSVAQRIAVARPDVAKQIKTLKDAKDPSGKMVTLYRGITREPKDFISDLSTLSEKSPAWSNGNFLSPDLDMALGYSTHSDQRIVSPFSIGDQEYLKNHRLVTVLEYQVPQYFGEKKSYEMANGEFKQVYIKKKEIDDSRPFISRVGVIDLSRNGTLDPKLADRQIWNSTDIHWFAYEEVFKNGIPANPNAVK